MRNNDYLSTMQYDCFALNWDSDYFGVKSARVNLKTQLISYQFSEVINYCEKFEFITISNEGNINENNQALGHCSNLFLADMNIQFSKNTERRNITLDKRVKIKNNMNENKDIIRLADLSFEYSRFFNDSNLDKDKAFAIYSHWTQSAFNRNDKYFVVVEENNICMGYLLFKLDNANNLGVIELIAVNDEYRGQGIGTTLIEHMEQYVFEQGMTKIKVGTQANNISAIGFYTSIGFRYTRCSSIYHMWNK